MHKSMRHKVHTTQERRYSQEGWGRARRNMANLPNSWDEFWYSPQRSWKKHRRTQYRT